jgi:hypothetical protein
MRKRYSKLATTAAYTLGDVNVLRGLASGMIYLFSAVHLSFLPYLSMSIAIPGPSKIQTYTSGLPIKSVRVMLNGITVHFGGAMARDLVLDTAD